MVFWFLASAVSSAAYKRWEKAAIAGVSLVADAAEHVERTATDKGIFNIKYMLFMFS